MLPRTQFDCRYSHCCQRGFPSDSVVKNMPANTEDMGSIPGSRQSPGEGNGKPIQYSCLGNPVDRGVWQVTVHGVTKNWTWLSNWTATAAKSISATSAPEPQPYRPPQFPQTTWLCHPPPTRKGVHCAGFPLSLPLSSPESHTDTFD